LYVYDPEIEKTLHLLNRARILSEHALEPEIEHDHAFDSVSLDSRNSRSSHIRTVSLDTSSHSNNMDNKTLKELVAPDVTYQPLYIQYPS